MLWSEDRIKRNGGKAASWREDEDAHGHWLHRCVAEGVELIGVRGCRALRQALGVAGVRALDSLLQARMADGVRQLSTALSSANTGRHLLQSTLAQNLRTDAVALVDNSKWKSDLCSQAGMSCVTKASITAASIRILHARQLVLHTVTACTVSSMIVRHSTAERQLPRQFAKDASQVEWCPHPPWVHSPPPPPSCRSLPLLQTGLATPNSHWCLQTA